MTNIEYLNFYTLYIESIIWPYIGFVIGGLSVPVIKNLHCFLIRIIAFIFSITLSIELGIALFKNSLIDTLIWFQLPQIETRIETLAVGFIAGVFFYLCFLRWGMACIDQLKSLVTRKSSLRLDRLLSRDEVKKLVPKPYKFNPIKYFKKSKNGSYGGLTERKKTFFIQEDIISQTHICVPGGSGNGKSAHLLSLAACRIKNHQESLIYCDPKPDKFAYTVLKKIAKLYGKKLHVIDLESSTPIINPYFNSSQRTSIKLSSAAFGLGENGGDASFYRSIERKSARKFSSYTQKYDSLSESLSEFESTMTPKQVETNKFLNDMEELISLPSMTASKENSIDIGQCIENGDLIYIIGSSDDEAVVNAQKMLLTIITQYCQTRPIKNSRPVNIIIDEFKFFLSRPVLTGMSTLRDKGARLWIAHQSFGDFNDCGQDLDPEFVRNTILANTGLKFCYNIPDADTAKMLAELSGTRVVEERSSEYTINAGLSETKENNSHTKQVETHYIPINVLLELPKNACIVYGAGLPQLVFTAPIFIDDDELIDINEYRLALKTYNSSSEPSKKDGDLIDVD